MGNCYNIYHNCFKRKSDANDTRFNVSQYSRRSWSVHKGGFHLPPGSALGTWTRPSSQIAFRGKTLPVTVRKRKSTKETKKYWVSNLLFWHVFPLKSFRHLQTNPDHVASHVPPLAHTLPLQFSSFLQPAVGKVYPEFLASSNVFSSPLILTARAQPLNVIDPPRVRPKLTRLLSREPM